jgi:hypothetical protein
VSLDRPAALVQNRLGHDGYPHLQVMDIKDGSDPLVAALTHAAEECWRGGAHTGWQLLTQPIVSHTHTAGGADAWRATSFCVGVLCMLAATLRKA